MNNSANVLLRPSIILKDIAQRYPDAWKHYEMFRRERGLDGLPDWPDWCYCPMSVAYAIVSGGTRRLGISEMPDVQVLSALAAWRVTQGIYRFDSTLATAILETPIEALPADILYRLPEWCVYIEAQGVPGFFAHLEWDTNTGRKELRFLVDGPSRLEPMILHLDQPTLGLAVGGAITEARTQMVKAGIIEEEELTESIESTLQKEIPSKVRPLLNLVLYLCAENADLNGERPRRPDSRKTKKGWRMFPPDKPRVWDVGFRIGAAFRAARLSEQQDGQTANAAEPGRQSPRPHIRRAHWHTYRVGEKRSGSTLRWLPPIPININEGEIVPTIRSVKSGSLP